VASGRRHGAGAANERRRSNLHGAQAAPHVGSRGKGGQAVSAPRAARVLSARKDAVPCDVMQDLTTGSVTRHLLKTTSFMLVTMLFQTLYFLVDLYWVGRLGKEAVAGVGVAGNLMFIVLAITQMLGVGTTVLISHA